MRKVFLLVALAVCSVQTQFRYGSFRVFKTGDALLTGRFLQFSDFHYDMNYTRDGDPKQMCRKSNETQPQPLGEYGDYKCDANAMLVENMLIAAKSVIPNPDFIFWTGDNFPHIDDYSIEQLEQTLQLATETVNKYYGNSTVLPLFGNHDYAPANAFPDNGSEVYRTVFKYWSKWIGEENRETFERGGYYKFILPNNELVLALNTNLYYQFNSAISNFSDKLDPAEQFNFMRSSLENARNASQTVIVIAHIAPGVFEKTPNFTWMTPDYNEFFNNITAEYASTIKWMIFGHHHTDTFHVVKTQNSKYQPVQVYLMAPAVTPWFSTLPGAGSNNPAFRIYEYDTASYNLLDAKTYMVNLTELNKNSSTAWELEYSMKDAYGISQINATTMNGVLERMKNDDALFKKYIEYNSVRWDLSVPEDQFRGAQLCSIEFVDFDDYYNCMAPYTSSTPASTTTQSSTTSNSAAGLPGVRNFATLVAYVFASISMIRYAS